MIPSSGSFTGLEVGLPLCHIMLVCLSGRLCYLVSFCFAPAVDLPLAILCCFAVIQRSAYRFMIVLLQRSAYRFIMSCMSGMPLFTHYRNSTTKSGPTLTPRSAAAHPNARSKAPCGGSDSPAASPREQNPAPRNGGLPGIEGHRKGNFTGCQEKKAAHRGTATTNLSAMASRSYRFVISY